jgi:bacillithiol biosynthesis cysteine-adding enzyme BshC
LSAPAPPNAATASGFEVVPFDRYPGLPELFKSFLSGAPEFFPDRPTLEAAADRGRRLLGTPARAPSSAFRHRGAAAAQSAEDLAGGRAVAVIAGHQVGLFTGPLFTIVKAFDAIRLARQLRERGVSAVPVFWALTDDHDLEEVARTAKPGKEAPETFLLEGADRSNRSPVGGLPLPARVTEVLDAFAADARAPGAAEIIEAFRRRYVPGATYGEAFIETLLDLAGDELLVVDPYEESLRPATAEFFRLAVEKRAEIRDALAAAASRVEAAGFPVPVPFRSEVFPFFTVARGERRRVDDPERAAQRVASGEEWPSTDVLTRPVLKSWLFPIAASVLGPSELAYHAQALSLFPIFGVQPPVLFPRSFVVPVGPPERRAVEALGIPVESLLVPAAASAPVEVPAATELAKKADAAERSLAELEPSLAALDSTLVGALENTRKKVAYQFEQLAEKMKKAAERKDEIANQRRRRLDTMLLPQGGPAERLYPPLVPMLAYGSAALDAIRKAASGSLEGAVVAELGGDAADGR